MFNRRANLPADVTTLFSAFWIRLLTLFGATSLDLSHFGKP
jgi:hypothetical protein